MSAAPKLLVRKGLLNVGGKSRPAIQVQAIVEGRIGERLANEFGNELLFRRAVYANGFPEGTPRPNPSLAPHLGNFVKNDACPEITVKTLMAGQTFQGNTLWEMLSFEYVAERAFDSLAELALTVATLGKERVYWGLGGPDVAAFAADAAADLPVLAVDAA